MLPEPADEALAGQKRVAAAECARASFGNVSARALSVVRASLACASLTPRRQHSLSCSVCTLGGARCALLREAKAAASHYIYRGYKTSRPTIASWRRLTRALAAGCLFRDDFRVELKKTVAAVGSIVSTDVEKRLQTVSKASRQCRQRRRTF